MKKKLPRSHSETAIPIAFPKRRKAFDFPNIYRFITESSLVKRGLYAAKVLFVSVISALLLFQIVIRGIALFQNLEKQQKIMKERAAITEEINYWKDMAKKYKNYRDVYFRIATLEYKLGDIDESKKYMKKSLELDPNFEEAHVLGEKIGL